MARQWRQRWPDDHNPRIGVMLPAALAVPVTMLSLWAAEKVQRFSTSPPALPPCWPAPKLAGVKQIITSKTFLERARLNVQAMTDAGIEFIYLEDVRAAMPRWRQWLSLLSVTLNPRGLTPHPRL